MSEFTDNDRPPVSAEVRAWLTVSVVLVLQLVGAVWWAATLSAEVRGLRDLVVTQVNDHEQRIRDIERNVRLGQINAPR